MDLVWPQAVFVFYLCCHYLKCFMVGESLDQRLLCFVQSGGCCVIPSGSRTSSNSGECCVTLDPTNTRTQSHAGTERLRQAWDYWIKNSIWQQSLSKDATVAHSSYSISKERQLQSWLSFHLGDGMLITGAHEDRNLLSMILLMMMINMLPLKRTIAVTWHLLCHIGAS